MLNHSLLNFNFQLLVPAMPSEGIYSSIQVCCGTTAFTAFSFFLFFFSLSHVCKMSNPGANHISLPCHRRRAAANGAGKLQRSVAGTCQPAPRMSRGPQLCPVPPASAPCLAAIPSRTSQQLDMNRLAHLRGEEEEGA